MRIHPTLVLSIALAWAPVDVSRAYACSVPFDKIATDKDLTRWSDAIVRARAEAYVEPPCPPDAKCADNRGKIRFRVVEVVKGPYPSAVFHAWGRLDSQLNESGSCYTTTYKPEVEFLLFLEETAGIWVVMPVPMAATNREISGEHDPRVVEVRAELKRLKQPPKRPRVAQ